MAHFDAYWSTLLASTSIFIELSYLFF